MNVLVVVDDTAAVAGIASSLPARLGQLAPVFAAYAPGQPPLHVAFIPGTVPAADCPPPASRAAGCGVAPDSFLAAGYCNVDPNFDGPMSDAFACLADFGASDCGSFQPLEAARRALADAPRDGTAVRAPFLTPGAGLAILIVAGQDDASPDTVESYLSAFAALAPGPVTSALLGPEGCPADGPIGPADLPRLNQFVNGSDGVRTSLCDASLTPALTGLVTKSGVLYLQEPLEGARDLDPDQPGLQASCTAVDDVTEADGTHQVTSLQACDAAQSVMPCLSIVWEGGAWRPRVQRGPDPVAPCGPLETRDTVTCVGCTDPHDPACATVPPPGG